MSSSPHFLAIVQVDPQDVLSIATSDIVQVVTEDITLAKTNNKVSASSPAEKQPNAVIEGSSSALSESCVDK